MFRLYRPRRRPRAQSFRFTSHRYFPIQVKSREEAIELTKRFPNPAVGGKAGEIEVRQFFELEDFGPSEAVDRFREIGVGAKR